MDATSHEPFRTARSPQGITVTVPDEAGRPSRVDPVTDLGAVPAGAIDAEERVGRRHRFFDAA